MIDQQWLTQQKIECTKHGSNSIWWDLVNELFTELQASRRKTEDARRETEEAQRRFEAAREISVTLLEEKCARLG